MATFDEAIKLVIQDEGGYVWDPDDPGGETKYGITKRAYPELNIKTLTVAQAEQIYHRDYWNPIYDQIADQAAANKLFDLSVNEDGPDPGHRHPRESVKLLQRALEEIRGRGSGARDQKEIKDDGIFGPATLAALNAAEPERLWPEWRARCAWFYGMVVANRPTSRKYLLGWMRRAVR